ncbi:MAG TPA: hypothetical protein VMF52_14120 [Steroidobacteraceae bacterium]|nr:hypothetical protein [Steroidobacteraceae bacterium]
MPSDLRFYASTRDLRVLLAAIEATQPVDYVRMGNEPVPPPRFPTYDELPSLGRTDAAEAADCARYLVVAQGAPVTVRDVRSRDGTIYFRADQLENAHSVTFATGGLRADDVLLPGRVSTMSAEPESEALMTAFSAAIRQHFTWIKTCWVGHQAEWFLDAGKRLTASIASPPEHDLLR